MTAQKLLLLAFSFYYWLLVSVIKLLSLCSKEKQENTYLIQRLGYLSTYYQDDDSMSEYEVVET